MIPFNRPFLTGNELRYIEEAHARGHLAGDGQFTRRCHEWLRAETGAAGALLTHSCTAALEMTALLAEIAPGDEVIMPSYTFVSTANAFVPSRRECRCSWTSAPDTLNIDETLIEAAITRAHARDLRRALRGGRLRDGRDHGDRAAPRIAGDRGRRARPSASRYAGRPLGSFGALAAFSFHETKNIISGEGGALLVNDPGYIERAEIIREKGTDRSQVLPWPGRQVHVGAMSDRRFFPAKSPLRSSVRRWNRPTRSPSEDCASGTAIVAISPISSAGSASGCRSIPPRCTHNGHMFYVLLRDLAERGRFIEHLKQRNIHGVFHYVPLHSSPAGIRLGRAQGPLRRTVDLSERIVRLPLWLGLEARQDEVIAAAHEFFS